MSAVFCEDTEDSFFINIQTVRGDKVTRTTTIIKPDLQQWLSLYAGRGYEVQTST